MQNSKIITDISGLSDIIQFLQKQHTIAFDIEADSIFHFKEKVCLIQFAADNFTALVDPLQIQDLSQLKPLFQNPKIKKISHGASYDIHCLYKDFDIKIENLFDTQVACKFLGIKKNGLKSVIQQRFNIELDKKYQKKDWSQRPLPEKMIHYAVKDAQYLIPLARILEKELVEKNRLPWAVEECDAMCRIKPKEPVKAPLFIKVKGAAKLSPLSLAILEQLLIFRQETAEKKDRPLFKIIETDSLLKIAREKPNNIDTLKDKQLLSSKQIEMYGAQILQIIQNNFKIEKKQLPIYKKQKKLYLKLLRSNTPDFRKNSSDMPKTEALKKWRQSKSRILKIEPGFILNKSVLNAIVFKSPKNIKELNSIEELKDWQKNEFGREILEVLRKAS